MKRNAKAVGEICLYGGGAYGAGWLAGNGQVGQPGYRQIGNGEPRPGGDMRALVDINHAPYYGDMQWEAAPQYVISADDILAAQV